MSAEQWAALDPETRAEIAEVLNSGGPERTAAIIRGSLTQEQMPHAEAIIEAYEDALHQASLTPEERAGNALTEAHRRGEDPAEVFHRWR